MTSWHSYPSIYSLGHKALATLLHGRVVLQEKIDGSQFSFGVFEEPELLDNRLRMRSKGKEFVEGAHDKMFDPAVQTVKRLLPQLQIGWTYRAEFLGKPKHNVLTYDRVPKGNLILFDINDAEESYLSPEQVKREALRLELDAVPTFFEGKGSSVEPEMLKWLLEGESILGRAKIEGIVIKAYDQFDPQTKKVLMGKFVSEAFKETHKKDWKTRNPDKKEVIQGLIEQLRTEARWRKAVQHLRDDGRLEVSPRDIPNLIAEVHADILKENAEDIREVLWQFAWQHIRRGVVSGLPQWYKEELLREQFVNTEVK